MGKHVTMKCGWGCGEELTARGIREHFRTCPKRPAGWFPLVAVVKSKEPTQRVAAEPVDRGAGITVVYDDPDFQG